MPPEKQCCRHGGLLVYVHNRYKVEPLNINFQSTKWEGYCLKASQIHPYLKHYVIANMCSILTKGSTCRKSKKIEIFVDLNRAGHDKSVEKKISVLAQIFTKLWSIYELHNYIILIIILNIII